jgi:hypothetical protein
MVQHRSGYMPPKNAQWGGPIRPIISTNLAPMYSSAKYLAGPLGICLSNSLHHAESSDDIIHTVDTLYMMPENILISFGLDSLFTKVPGTDELKLSSQ